MAVAGSLTYDTKLDTKGFSEGLSKVGSATKNAFKGVGVAIGAVATAITGITVAATNAYADYEQLVGGVDTLFKTSSKKLQNYADIAYKTAGISANNYMETVTSFSASLIQSTSQVLDEEVNAQLNTLKKQYNELEKTSGKGVAQRKKDLKKEIEALSEHLYKTVQTEESLEKAADMADQAIIDMADNANKMGTSLEMIQNAYQGFAKQNYTMLDNLKLGYGGTKEEMERLIDDANKIKEANGEMADLTISSFADITEAIHIIQTEMGITGTTAKEASSTITGSVNAMKGAWENLLVGLANGDADLNTLINNLFNSISTVATNIMPVVTEILKQVPIFIEQLITVAVEQIPTVINELIPTILNSAITILNTLIQGIEENLDTIVNGAMTIITTLIEGILPMLPQILEMGIEILFKLMEGIAEALPDLVPQIVNVIIKIMEVFNDNFNEFLLLGAKVILGLIEGLINSIPDILKNLPTIIMAIINFFTLSKFLALGKTIIKGLINGLTNGIPNLLAEIPKLIGKIISSFKSGGWSGVGKDLIRGIISGFTSMGSFVKTAVVNVAKSMLGSLKSFFGIKSPSRVMRDQVGQWLPKGIAVGIDANTDSALNSIDKMNDEIMNKMSQAVNMETAKASFSGTSGSVSQILSANSVIQVENYNRLYLDGEQIHENQQTVQQRKDLQYSFGGGVSK